MTAENAANAPHPTAPACTPAKGYTYEMYALCNVCNIM